MRIRDLFVLGSNPGRAGFTSAEPSCGTTGTGGGEGSVAARALLGLGLAFRRRRVSMPAALGAAAWAAAFAVPAMALPSYVDNFPNGTTIDGVGCINCHNSAQGGDARNPFGKDLGGSTDWAAVCPDDSDGDGLSNGEELGDPDCIWTRGDTPTSVTDISNPGEGAGGCASTGTGNAAGLAVLGIGLLVIRRRRA